MTALLSINMEYIVLILAAKKDTKIRLFLIEISILNTKIWYMEIKVLQKNKRIEQVKVNIIR